MDSIMENTMRQQPKNISATAYKLLLLIFWAQYTILGFAVQVIRRLPIIGSFYEYVIPFCVVVLLVLALPWIMKKICVKDILFYFFCLIVVLGSMVLFHKNFEYIEADLWNMLGLTFTIYFIGLAYEHEDCKQMLFWISLLGSVLTFAYQFYSLSLGRELLTDNLDTAYKMLPSVLYLIYWALEQKKVIYWVVVIVAAIMTFMFGTRGPILSILVFIMLGIFFSVMNDQSQMKKKILYLVVFSVVIYFISSETFLLSAAEFMADIFEDIGFSTRIFDHFLEGEIAQSKGREILSEKIFTAIQENPILGYGVMGDRPIVGFYVHNLFLEIWCHFGVILGSILLLFIIGIPFKALLKSRKSSIFGFVLMLICMVFVKLMFTGSYVVEPYLFFLLGISINAIRNKEKMINYQQRDVL